MPPMTGTGRVIAGRYNLVEPIGRGAMGVVWRARDSLLDRDVAIKEVVLNGPIGDEERENAYKRTMREARTAARLSHRGVVTVFDVAEEDGRPWIIMELVQSRSLDQVLAADGPLPPRRACVVGRQLLAALAAAHAAGVLHRDVKPSNVLIADDPDGERAVLTDFGIAQFAGDPRLTQTGMVMGSPGFTAPERIRGGNATPASDLWSLGATLYAAVQGKGPYEERGGAITTMSAIINEDAPPASSAGPLGPLIAALLRRDPRTRPSAAAATRMFAGVLPLLPEVPPPARRTPTLTSTVFPVPAQSPAGATSQDELPDAAPADPAPAGTAEDAPAAPAVPDSAASAAAVDGPAAAEPGASDDDSDGAAVSQDAASEDAVAENAVAEDAVAEDVVAENAASENTPSENAAADEPPADEQPAAGEPAAEKPVDEQPAADRLSGKDAGVDQAAGKLAGTGQPNGDRAHGQRPAAADAARDAPVSTAVASVGEPPEYDTLIAAGPAFPFDMAPAAGSPGSAHEAWHPAKGQQAYAGETVWPVRDNRFEPITKPQPPFGPPPGPAYRPRRRRGRWAVVAAVVVLLAVAVGVGVALLMTRHGPVTTGHPGNTAAAASTGSLPDSVKAIDNPTAALPPGWSQKIVRPAEAGTAGGFSIGVPPGWIARQRGLATYLDSADGARYMDVDLTKHDRGNMVAEAQYVERNAIAQGHLPGYHRLSLRQVTIRGTAGAFWSFTWVTPGGVTMRVEDLLFELQTSAGPQSYAAYFTSSAAEFGMPQGQPLFDRILRTFQPLES